jgi:hypothetical protein
MSKVKDIKINLQIVNVEVLVEFLKKEIDYYGYIGPKNKDYADVSRANITEMLNALDEANVAAREYNEKRTSMFQEAITDAIDEAISESLEEEELQ